MAAALEEIRRQGAELEHAMANTMDDVDRLTAAGHNAGSALHELETVASHAENSLSDVNTSLNVLETAAVASQLTAAQAAEMAARAGTVVEETAQAIENLRAAVGQAQRRVTSLGRRSDDIDHIVDFITEVAGRTNLLSLNASIIAAQAGEHGKAFAVVADQIRELASQISSSTKSIGSIIRAVREDVEGTATLIHKGDELASAGVALSRNSLEAFHRMTGATVQGHETAAAIREAVQAHAKSSGEVSNLVQLIAKGSKAVGQAVELVFRSVAGVEIVSRGVETLADQVSRALQEQSGVGRKQLESLEQITGMISEVTLLVENHNSATRSVRDSLQHLSGTAEQHEEAVRELGAVAERLAARAQALAERVAKFRS
jgi:methyl-accepting chemotaxis protein